jgi:hypothetical protein
MNQPQSPSPLNQESVDSTRPPSFRGPEFLPHRAETQQNSTETWSLAIAGFLCASIIASLLSGLPDSHTLSWPRALLLSVSRIALTAAAGVAGVWIPWSFLRSKPSFSLTFMSKNLWVGWIFLPCIMLLYRQQSPWMFLVIALATIAGAFSLRRLFPADIEATEPLQSGDLSALYGLPPADFQPLRAFFIALCAQGAFLCAFTGYLLFAGALLSISILLLVWRWSALDSSALRRFAGKRPSILLCALAMFLTILTLIPWIGGRHFGSTPGSSGYPKPVVVARQQAEPATPGSDYVGIVLWPPPEKKKKILLPPPPAQSLATRGAAKPVVIPFDGPYWYFKAPSTKPGPHAHVARGKPTEVNIHSADWAPLLMEAHQNLGSSIDLNCCSEIDVTVTNADIRPGRIALGILLTDSVSPGRPFRALGERSLVSSEAVQIPLNRPPVDETLRFPIARLATMRRFDEITIIFLPAKERARGGAKVSIQSFTLIPK